MTLIERLRGAFHEPDSLDLEAANEIERLTAERDMLVEALKRLSGMKLNMVADGIVDKALAKVKP